MEWSVSNVPPQISYRYAFFIPLITRSKKTKQQQQKKKLLEINRFVVRVDFIETISLSQLLYSFVVVVVGCQRRGVNVFL